MFDLVADVESYPEFLPGCSSARIHAREGDCVVASIALAEGPLRTEFRTRNRFERPRFLDMKLEEGPFSVLDGRWEFTTLGPDGSKVALAIRFEFASRALDLMLGPAFEVVCNRLVDAFVRRAREMHA